MHHPRLAYSFLFSFALTGCAAGSGLDLSPESSDSGSSKVTACTSLLADCKNQPSCSALLSCAEACPTNDGGTCFLGCFNGQPAGQALYQALESCVSNP